MRKNRIDPLSEAIELVLESVSDEDKRKQIIAAFSTILDNLAESDRDSVHFTESEMNAANEVLNTLDDEGKAAILTLLTVSTMTKRLYLR